MHLGPALIRLEVDRDAIQPGAVVLRGTLTHDAATTAHR
jgi:hypothetical protein